MDMINKKHGKFFGPVQVYMGYVFIACGIFFVSYSFTTLLLVIPGTFMALTTSGTIIDWENKKVRPYTLLFGIVRTGKWIDVSVFSGFKILKSNRRYTSYSLGSVRLDMNIRDISLFLMNKKGAGKVLLNRYNKFEDAHREMDELKALLFPGDQTL